MKRMNLLLGKEPSTNARTSNKTLSSKAQSSLVTSYNSPKRKNSNTE